MAQPANSAYSTSSLIPFDSGRSYVVRSLPLKRKQFCFEDKMGRTEEDRAFLDQFETIFLAASKGDLATCKRVVDQGFCDFNAYSVGHFGTTGNVRLDQVSPLQIAEDRGHTDVVEFFKKFMGERNSPQAPVPELDPFLQHLENLMKSDFLDLNLNWREKEPASSKIENAAKAKSALPIPEIIDQSSK